ncbi:DNA-3-methyladenine glycosylase 2 family protein [Marinicauda salina]|uniref:DNA-3-methyladenine glycosylase II n=1 Tax=Marinicauda salina TaxID=2135793 RepID=A0A2U2BU43_9PROT|nr:DNA-3-methyladenine glycosylase [Marinicauda salina]PWE17502.1 DNA-3-methyladenine glycosylase 2 family protein [Marinicauda salina]
MSAEIHARFIDTAAGVSPALAEAIETLGPVTLPDRTGAPFPVYLCRAVAGQQLSVKAARTIWGRVEASAGARPLLEHFHEQNEDALRACGLSGAKTRTICAIAEAARDGRLEADELAALDSAERARRLTALWGVGQWTADMAAMFYFRDPDIWPDGDVAARKTLEKLTSKRRKTARTAARFAPHRSYLALYMWRWVDARPT